MTTQPGISGLDNNERRFLAETLQRLRARDPWLRGNFAEAVVAEALPSARLSSHSAAPHDVEWAAATRTITIAVRATGAYSMDHDPNGTKAPFAGAWKFPRDRSAWDGTAGTENGTWREGTRRCWADVAVLCKHDGFDIRTGWTFHVLPGEVIEHWPAEALRPSTVTAAGYPAVPGDELARSVTEAAAHRKRV